MRRMTVVCLCSFFQAVAAVFPIQAGAEAFNPWNLDFGLETGQFTYKEPGIMSEEGLQLGPYAAYSRTFSQSFRAHAYVSLVGGDLDYEGGLQGVDPATGEMFVIPATASTPNTIFNLRFTGGYRIALGRGELTPFIGYGYRFLRNDLNQPLVLEGGEVYDDPRSGYWREQSYHYLPFGLFAAAPLGGGWQIEGTMELDYFLRGRNNSYNDYWMDYTFKQDSGSGYRFAVKFLSPVFFDRLRLTFEHFYERWDIDDSDRVIDGGYYLVEPANNSTQYGLRFGVRLEFSSFIHAYERPHERPPADEGPPAQFPEDGGPPAPPPLIMPAL